MCFYEDCWLLKELYLGKRKYQLNLQAKYENNDEEYLYFNDWKFIQASFPLF